ncbi:MAG TPA: hypothetical protein DCX14_03400 [Flavobacteriales bacterium]|jgi:formiminoglutamase|nr:arginase [Flavobacteriales bacterium]HAW19205.1 hypothetical protein [Flavobacteriales bacterium]
MKFSDYFDKLEITPNLEGTISEYLSELEESSDLEGCKMALMFVSETRYSQTEPLRNPQSVLDSLSGLFPHGFEPKIGLLGCLRLGKTLEDTEYAITQIVLELFQHRVLPVVIGGDRELTYSIYKAFEELEQIVNIASIDNILNINGGQGAYIGRIIKEQPNYLFNYSNLGYQTYLVSGAEIELADELYFDVYRLGQMRGSIELSEPLIRSADILSISMDSVKASDFKSSTSPQPNGFYAEEICQTLRYAGLGEKLRAVVITETSGDVSGVDALLISEMVWCLIDGLYSRRSEIPSSQNSSFLKYRVSLKNDEFNVVFYKSLNTDRWWMEVPVPPEYANKYRRHHLIPCDYNDYKEAANDDLPERWWRAYKKML